MLYFGPKLRKLRKENELTQQQLADKLDVTKGTVSAYETNAKYPSVEVLIKIATVFSISADYLLGLSETSKFENSKLTDEQNLLITDLAKQFVHLNNITRKI
ncbi:MAG: helix-turn-helix domain-containing protein [Anaerotignaceae bacterium]